MRLTYQKIIIPGYMTQLQKTYFHSCAPSEDSDQPAHSRSLIRNYTWSIWIAMNAKFLQADNEDSDQTAGMRRLIRGWVVRTYRKVLFLTASPIFFSSEITNCMYTYINKFDLHNKLSVILSKRISNLMNVGSRLRFMIYCMKTFLN